MFIVKRLDKWDQQKTTAQAHDLPSMAQILIQQGDDWVFEQFSFQHELMS